MVSTLMPLSAEDLMRVLTDVKDSLISQYTALFEYSGIEIQFTKGALIEIACAALQRGGGARGLRSVVVSLCSI